MKQRKRVITFLILFICVFSGAVAATSDDADDMNDTLLEEDSLGDVQDFWDKLVTDYGGYLPEIEKVSVYEFIKNNESLSLKNVLKGFIKFLFYELILNGKLLGSLLMLTLFSVLLQTIHNAFEHSAVSKIAYFVVYIVLIYIALNSFFSAYSYALETIETMSSFMIALIPLVLGLMATFGNIITVSFFHPIIIFLIHSSGLLISNLILPLLFLSALLLIVGTINENYRVKYLADLFRTVSIGILGGFLTIFLGVMSVQGTASAIQDGVAMKTAKFVTGNFIPVIGRTFTDATDTVLSASLVLKNAVGIVGVIIILFIALFPALKVFAIALTFKISAAVLQPIGDGPVITILHVMSKSITYILACLLAVTLMFFLAIVIIIVASNVTLLLR